MIAVLRAELPQKWLLSAHTADQREV